jgi:hypothetical protein
MGSIEYAVVDDYGDDWENGDLIFRANTFRECEDWAENENYHSASIVRINTCIGERTRVYQ